jgi:ribosomal protein L37AE/L43A
MISITCPACRSNCTTQLNHSGEWHCLMCEKIFDNDGAPKEAERMPCGPSEERMDG